MAMVAAKAVPAGVAVMAVVVSAGVAVMAVVVLADVAAIAVPADMVGAAWGAPSRSRGSGSTSPEVASHRAGGIGVPACRHAQQSMHHFTAEGALLGAMVPPAPRSPPIIRRE
eukprot:1044091-Pelagomonas_calceolata.AAC.10